MNELRCNEKISFSVIELNNYSVLKKIKDLAVKKLPPFENKDNTDKGFKDAYIYFTILEYLEKIEDKYVYLNTNDGLLRDAFEKNYRVRVIHGYDDFIEKSISIVLDAYLIEKFNEELGFTTEITKESLTDYWFSIQNNDIFFVCVQDQNYLVEVESGEIIDFKNADLYKESIQNFVNSQSWSNTHKLAGFLRSYINFYEIDDAQRIVLALTNNDQVYGAFGYGVKDFYTELYNILEENSPSILNEQIRKFFT